MANLKHRQSGSVFLMSLMLLIVVTLLTFSVSQTVLLQEKMTGNGRDSELALQVAEAALLAGEARIKSMNLEQFNIGFAKSGAGLNETIKGFYDGTTCTGSDSVCYINTLSDPYAESTWVNAIETSTVDCGNGVSGCLLTGKYLIIKLGVFNTTRSGKTLEAITNQYQGQGEGAVLESYKYKIMAMGVGNNPENKRVLVSYFAQSKPLF